MCSRTAASTTELLRMYVCMVITYSKSKDQPGKVAKPAHGQLNKENGNISLSPFAPENLVYSSIKEGKSGLDTMLLPPNSPPQIVRRCVM